MGKFLQPTTLSDALAWRAAGANVLAGGTDFWPARVDKPIYRAEAPAILDLSRLAELRGISQGNGEIRIGALATWSQVAEEMLPPACRALQLAAREVGGRQIQNRGTIAGNLCNASPAADSVPPLLVMGAEIELASVAGVRTVPVAEFLRGPRDTALRPDELVTAVVLPMPGPAARSHFMKLGARKYQLISVVMAAGLIEVHGDTVTRAAVAIGACSPVAMRLPALEQALVGCPVAALCNHVEPDQFADLRPIDDVRADARYRRDAALTLVRRLLASFEHGR